MEDRCTIPSSLSTSTTTLRQAIDRQIAQWGAERERGQEQDRPLFLHTTGGLSGRNSEDVGLQGFQVFLLLGIMMGYGL